MNTVLQRAAMVLALLMTLSVAACGGEKKPAEGDKKPAAESNKDKKEDKALKDEGKGDKKDAKADKEEDEGPSDEALEEEYTKKADKEINADNAKAVADQLAKEIEADLAAE